MNNPVSGAMYATDLMLGWETNEKGEKVNPTHVTQSESREDREVHA